MSHSFYPPTPNQPANLAQSASNQKFIPPPQNYWPPENYMIQNKPSYISNTYVPPPAPKQYNQPVQTTVNQQYQNPNNNYPNTQVHNANSQSQSQVYTSQNIYSQQYVPNAENQSRSSTNLAPPTNTPPQTYSDSFTMNQNVEEHINGPRLVFVALDFSSQRYELPFNSEHLIDARTAKAELKRKYPESLAIRKFEIISPYDSSSLLADEQFLKHEYKPDHFDLPYILYFIPVFPFSDDSPLNRDVKEINTFRATRQRNRTIGYRGRTQNKNPQMTYSGATPI